MEGALPETGSKWSQDSKRNVEMLIVAGKSYATVADAAKYLGVSTKAVQGYIGRGIIPRPPEIRQGLRSMQHFPPAYLERAKVLIERYHDLKKTKRDGRE